MGFLSTILLELAPAAPHSLIAKCSLTTSLDSRLEQSVYLGLFHREVSKFDESAKPIYFSLDQGMQTRMWSKMMNGRLLDKTPAISKLDTSRPEGNGSRVQFEAYASCSVRRLDIMDFCTLYQEDQATLDLQEKTPILERLLSSECLSTKWVLLVKIKWLFMVLRHLTFDRSVIP